MDQECQVTMQKIDSTGCLRCGSMGCNGLIGRGEKSRNNKEIQGRFRNSVPTPDHAQLPPVLEVLGTQALRAM
jgi:hypothetical protein